MMTEQLKSPPNVSYTKPTQDSPEAAEVKAAAQVMLTFDPSDGAGDSDYLKIASALGTLYKYNCLTSMVPALPLLLTLKGKAYSLLKHFPLEPLFSLRPPRTTVIKAGRQISKSTGLAAQGCVQSAVIPYFNTLFIAPRFDQTRRFSNNYVKPFIQHSPIGQALVSSAVEQNVLQRTFINGSIQQFTFAFLDCDRARGIPSDCNKFDEVQDIDPDFIPIINASLDASDYKLRQYSGTPKTFDNPLEAIWEESSQAEWIIPCKHCNHLNIPSVQFDLLKMILPQGLSCAKCQRHLLGTDGYWVHAYPERMYNTCGYHVPQPILPMHYEPDPISGMMENWDEILKAMNGDKGTFFNEKLGESCDVRSSLLSKPDLRKASVLTHNNEFTHDVCKLAHKYPLRVMGVDWGGYGEDQTSYTTIAIIGFRADNTADVLYGERFIQFVDHGQESQAILHYYRAFRCHLLAHDINGAAAREVLLIQAGMPLRAIMPMSYQGAVAGPLVKLIQDSPGVSKNYYQVDKARTLTLLCQLIKYMAIRFPRFETWGEGVGNLGDDLLALVEDKHKLPRGGDIYRVTRKAHKSDDFAHSVNFAALAGWQWLTMRGHRSAFPDIASRMGMKITPEQQEKYNPRQPSYPL